MKKLTKKHIIEGQVYEAGTTYEVIEGASLNKSLHLIFIQAPALLEGIKKIAGPDCSITYDNVGSSKATAEVLNVTNRTEAFVIYVFSGNDWKVMKHTALYPIQVIEQELR